MYDRERELWIELIESYKEMPLLWDPKHKDYTNKPLRNAAYAKLLESYKKIDSRGTLVQMKKKLDNMRTTYNREKRKQTQIVETGEKYIPSLWYYENFSFLEETVELTRNKGGHTINFNRSKNKIYLEKTTPIKRELKRKSEEELEGNESTSSLKTPKIERTPLKFIKIAHMTSEHSEEEVVHDKTETSQPSQPKRRIYDLLQKQERFIDTASKLINKKEQEWEVIGKSIGLQLMNLESRQRTIANKLISDAIFYASMGRLTVDSTINIEHYEEDEPDLEMEHLDSKEMMYVETLDDD